MAWRILADLIRPNAHRVTMDLPDDVEVVGLGNAMTMDGVVIYLCSMDWPVLKPGEEVPRDLIVTVRDHGCPNQMISKATRALDPTTDRLTSLDLSAKVLAAVRDMPPCNRHSRGFP